MTFAFSICEDAAATWDASTSACTVGAVQVVSFVVDKECGGGNVLPGFCAPATPVAASGSGAPAEVSIFNLNVAEGAGIDRSKLVEKGIAIAARIAAKGSDVACLQEVWDEGERAALNTSLAAAGLTHTVPTQAFPIIDTGGDLLRDCLWLQVAARGAGLVISSRYPILQCGSAVVTTSPLLPRCCYC